MQQQIFENPPYCNTGVQSYIIPDNDKSYSIDWLQFTTGKISYGIDYEPLNSSIPLINKLLKKLKSYYNYYDLELIPGGLYGYRYRMEVAEGITIYFFGSENKKGEKTTLIKITGKGCDRFNNIDDWFELIGFLLSDEIEASVTRLDLAIDDFYGKEISYKKFFDVVKKKFFIRSGHPKSKPHWHINDWNDYDEGCTIDFYSPSSDVQLCVYNKKAETRSKNNLDSNTPQWMRYEMRFFDEQAMSQIRNYYICLVNEKFDLNKCSSISQFLSSALYELLKLYNPCNDSNKSRWKELPEWLDFIGELKYLSFERKKSNISKILKTKLYFENQYARFLIKMYLTFGSEFLEVWIKDLIYKKRHVIEPDDLVEVNDLRIDLNKNKLSKMDLINLISKAQILDPKDIDILRANNLNVLENPDADEIFNKLLNKIGDDDGISS